ncbi:agamous-like MADS-box protein AGL82 [Rhododendron vialii]|uniref:agamous-like MADS-box protein AGL82 n=1 Tax=Rhododendron vialii TaxID=182163 RepID=UPI00265E709A|nr:agamous-like MADS-box protein AGL82 [Rhododendron vialii]
MGRAKQRMELIRNGKSRYVTFQKRKKGMKKKAYELQTLCDVEVCLIVYGPTTDEHHNNPLEAEIWPENPDTIHHLLDSYKNQPPEERVKKTQTLSNFFIDRNQKIEDSLVKLRKKNDDATYSTWDDRYSNWSMEQLRGFEITLEGKLRDVKARIALMKGTSSLTQNPPPCFLQGMFGMRNTQWEERHEQQPISMLNSRHEFVNAPFHYPFDQEIQQAGIQSDANLMANPVMMTQMNYGSQYSSIQLGGVSSSKFMCNLPLERPIYGYDPLIMPVMSENMVYNNTPLPIGYCNPNMETMLPYLPCFKMGSNSSHMDKYFKASEFQTNNQN